MKANHLLLLAFTAIAAFSFQGCLKDKCEREVSYIRIDPVYKTLNEIRNGTVVNEAPRELKKPGQLYFYNNFIFINERREGIHIIDNSNPNSPQKISFLSIPGNEDLAIRNGMLYANSYIDLWAIDLQDFTLKGRAENVFPPMWEDLENNRVAVYYEETPVTEVMDCQTYSTLYRVGDDFFLGGPGIEGDIVNAVDQNNSGGISGGGTGTGGSMARFSAIGDFLYVVDQFSLKVFGLSNPAVPNLANTVNIGWGIETIFPYQDKLFIGSNSGMFIFDNSNPVAPVQLASFAHARACDPVFVKGDFAYVTLRSGNFCDGFNNQLDLINIKNITSPFLVKTFPMDNPHGLSIKDNNLLLCEGSFGVKSFDITEPQTLNQHQLDHVKNIHAFDVISLPGQQNIALVIGENGFYQYNFDNPSDMKLISKIPVSK